MFASNDNQPPQPCHFSTDNLIGQLAKLEHDISDDPNNLELQRELAGIYLTLGRWNLAFDKCNKILHLDPSSDFAYATRGQARLYLGDYMNALADFDHSLKVNPQYAIAFVYRADVEVMMNDWKKAISDYSASLALDPMSVYSRVQRARCFCAVWDYQKAEDDYHALELMLDSASQKEALWQEIFG